MSFPAPGSPLHLKPLSVSSRLIIFWPSLAYFPLRRAIGLAALLRTLPLIAQWMLTAGWFEVSASTVIPITCAEHFFGGMLTTAMFALMMSKVDRRIGATHYTVLASVEVIGKSITGLSSGWLADRTSYATVNAVAVVASFAFLFLLLPMRKAGGPDEVVVPAQQVG